MPEEPARRPLQVDISTLDLVHARTEALRLLASAETDLDVHLTEAARVLTDLFDGLDLDAVEDAELSTLTHRVLEIVAGLMMVASRSREDQRSPPRRWDERPAYRRHAAGPGTPWPIRFYFLNISDDEHPEHREYLHVGFELGEHFASERGTRWSARGGARAARPHRGSANCEQLRLLLGGRAARDRARPGGHDRRNPAASPRPQAGSANRRLLPPYRRRLSSSARGYECATEGARSGAARRHLDGESVGEGSSPARVPRGGQWVAFGSHGSRPRAANPGTGSCIEPEEERALRATAACSRRCARPARGATGSPGNSPPSASPTPA